MRPADAAGRTSIDVSRYLSRVLRHEPQGIGLSLDPQGWAHIDELVERACAHGVPLTRDLVLGIVKKSDKQRFACDSAGRVRAKHGHTIPIDLGIEPSRPPSVLFHGTATASVASIKAGGLIPGLRRHVHLATNTVTAADVGRRRGWPVVLRVAAGRMWAAGFKFVRTANAVWLTDDVPAEFIRFPRRIHGGCPQCAAQL